MVLSDYLLIDNISIYLECMAGTLECLLISFVVTPRAQSQRSSLYARNEHAPSNARAEFFLFPHKLCTVLCDEMGERKNRTESRGRTFRSPHSFIFSPSERAELSYQATSIQTIKSLTIVLKFNISYYEQWLGTQDL